MPQLRLTLLVVGLIFLIGLTWWELRRSHQARGSDLPRPEPAPPDRLPERSTDWDMPALELPRMSARDPEAELPVIEVAPAEFAALEATVEATDPDDPQPITADFAADMASLAPEAAASSAVVGPATGGVEGLLAELGANQLPDPPISDVTESFRSAYLAEEVEAPVPHFIAAAPRPAAAARPVAPPDSVTDAPTAPVVVEWPSADASQVIAVRLVSTGEKFSGRAVRLALAAEGFVLGKFSIFHKPATDGRALLSIASLNKPGTFDAQGIDVQRYSGLNLFTVLPGPIPGPDAVDELLACAQVLSQRLRGSLQDGRGESLTPSRTAVMRNAAAAAPT